MESSEKKGYQHILFDLDGTLTESGPGIIKSAVYALNKFGIDVPDEKELYFFVGPPLRDSFMKYGGFSEEEAELAVKYYREYYTVKGLFENSVYAGIKELLSACKERGKKLYVATAKPEIFAKQILEYFGMDTDFVFIGGSLMTEERTRKAEVIEYVLKECHLAGNRELLMVGDRDNDVYGAHQIGIPCAGVLYGYGTEEELRKAGADYFVRSPMDLLEILD